MPRYIDISGRRFGRWSVLHYAGNNRHDCATFFCRCECGVEKVVPSSALRAGKSKSCGCWLIESRRTHGETGSAEFRAWQAMRSRCYTESSGNYAKYGGRGITVCDRWLGSFENFLADMGRKPSPAHSLDRINGSMGYAPDNCRWADGKTQSRNTRRNRWITFRGETLTMAEWNERIGGGSPNTVLSRLNQGWSVERALTQPVQARKQRSR